MPNTNILNNNGCFIISASSTPTSSEIANKQYKAAAIQIKYESVKSPDSGVVDDGTTKNVYVINRKRILEIELPTFRQDIDGSKYAGLIASVQGKEYYITYWDILTNGEKTIHVYTDSTAADCYSGVLYNGSWRGVSFVATEIKGEIDA